MLRRAGFAVVAGLLVLPSAGASAATLSIDSVGISDPGQKAVVCLHLDTEGQEIAGVQNEIVWDESCAQMVGRCRATGSHGKTLNSARPPGTTGVLRAFLLSFSDVDPIPDGELYCCEFSTRLSQPGASCALRLQNVLGSDPSGRPISLAVRHGRICLGECPGTAGAGALRPREGFAGGIEEPAARAPAERPQEAPSSRPRPEAEVARAPARPAAPVSAEAPEAEIEPQAAAAFEPSTPAPAAGGEPAQVQARTQESTPGESPAAAAPTEAAAPVQSPQQAAASPAPEQPEPTRAASPAVKKPTAPPTPVSPAKEEEKESGCQIGSRPQAAFPWWLLPGIVFAIAGLRRRRDDPARSDRA